MPAYMKERPLDNRVDKNGYIRSDYRDNPANRLHNEMVREITHEIKVDKFRKWRDQALRTVMLESIMLDDAGYNERGDYKYYLKE